MSKILIIDDERAIRRTLKEILQYEKFDVAEAEEIADEILSPPIVQKQKMANKAST